VKKHEHKILGVEPDSIGEELELLPGDILLDINGREIVDILDYRYLCQDEFLTLHIRRGEEEGFFEVEKDEYEDLGIEFESGLMDDYRSCSNRCVFCFIDQMPPGMRPTLYFKDDDARLSFLQGNYITLTNLSDEDMDRICTYHLEPINVSVHTMDPELRCRMLHNRFAGKALQKLDRLYEAGIHMNGQIVLCPGFNDGEALEYTIRRLSAYAPVMESVSVVPVGLTKYRDGLESLTQVTPEIARDTIRRIEAWQKVLYEKTGLHFIHASDEFYLTAGLPMPEADRYDGYLQLENGVGMNRLLQEEFLEALENCEEAPADDCLTIATGKLGEMCLRPLLDTFSEKFPNIRVDLVGIRNDFFGEGVTVTGLLTGQDLIARLSGRELGSRVLFSVNMLRSGESVFLDDITVDRLSERLGVPVEPVGESGLELLNALLGKSETLSVFSGYE